MKLRSVITSQGLRWFGLGAFVGIVSLLSIVYYRGEQRMQSPPDLRIPKLIDLTESLPPKALPLELYEATTGKPFDWAAAKNKVLFINFWATWCGPCIAEMPSIARLARKVQGAEVEFLLVSNEDLATVRRFAKKKKELALPFYSLKGRVSPFFETSSIPATFIIYQNRILYMAIGTNNYNNDVFVKMIQNKNL